MPLGIAREVKSVLDFNAPHCTILRRDAIDQGIQRGIIVKLHKVSVGTIVASDVDATVLELRHPRFLTYDFVLGRTFLKSCKLTVDVNKGYLSLR